MEVKVSKLAKRVRDPVRGPLHWRVKASQLNLRAICPSISQKGEKPGG